MNSTPEQVIPQHPMDNFPVRRLQFNFNDIENQDPLWSRSSRDFSMFINALGVHIPHFERYLVKTMLEARSAIKNDVLLRDMKAITGQEAQHAKNFIKYNKWLCRRYPDIQAIEQSASDYFDKHIEYDNLKEKVGYTAGYETFTFLSGLIILENYEKWLKDSDPSIKALWVWHQVEEVEHGAVAFDVYQELYGDDEWYRKKMVLKSLSHIAKETIRAYWNMCKVEGYLRNPFRACSKLGFCAYMLTRLLLSALPVFKKGYHPKSHRLVTNEQNSIQIAWRRFEKKGGNVLDIDHEKMAKMLKVSKLTNA